MDIVIPICEVLALGLPILFLVVRDLPQSERQRLTNVMVMAFLLRLLVATIFAAIPSTRVFHDDSGSYEATGMRLAMYWHGNGPPVDALRAAINDPKFPPGIFYFFGALYYALGEFRLVATAVTSLLGALSVMMVYRITRKLFHPRVAQRAASSVAFFPSMILWSAMALKDPVMIFAILLALDAIMGLRARFSPGAILQLFAALVAIWFVRYYISYLVLFVMFASAVMARTRRVGGTVTRQLIGGAIVVALLAFVGITGRLSAQMDTFSLQYVSGYRSGMVTTANSGFGAGADVSTPTGALAFLPIGLAVLLFGPLPWQMTSLRPILTLPEMLVWWSMVGALWRGLRYGATRMFGETVPLILFSAVACGVYALGMGNVGAAFRMRAQVLPFLLIFSAAGYYLELCRKKGLDPAIIRASTDAPAPVAAAVAST